MVDPAHMDYLSYTTKIYQLVQKCRLSSVLQYDREYRQLQASMDFRWGTDVQHLHMLHLQPRDKQVKSIPQFQNQKKKGQVVDNLHDQRGTTVRQEFVGTTIVIRTVLIKNVNSSTSVYCRVALTSTRQPHI